VGGAPAGTPGGWRSPLRLTIVAVGHRQPEWVDAGCREYLKRMPREYGLRVIEVKPEPRGDRRSRDRAVAGERVRIEAALPVGGRRVALDERGSELTTAAVAQRLAAWALDGHEVAFVIGGADGLDPALRTGADECWRLSALTLPHGLARLLLCEQLYRAHTLLIGHPYHRE
jgi:23S rRNA (pseudouridine1915-N3)-methyltransferase